ncbi:MAG: hypothetical protein MR350_02145 [Alphaproteobacteria bacterium]|nr:hypothetical protein [Alphaproteobacteria bacterium]
MKKFLFFVVFVLVSVVASAQTFVPVKSFAKKHYSFTAYGVDGSSAIISAEQYLELKDNGAGDYKIVSYKGKDEKSSFSGVVSNQDYTKELLQVDSTSVTADGVKVFFTNGKSYLAKSPLWSDVLKGQNVVHIVIKSSIRNFERYEALTTAPADFVENLGLRANAETKQTAFAKVVTGVKSAAGKVKDEVEEKFEKFIEPQETPKTTVYSAGGFKFIEE